MYGDMFKGCFTALIVVSAIGGAVVAYVIPWLWHIVKPWIHAVTG